jgi:hypothetical protein
MSTLNSTYNNTITTSISSPSWSGLTAATNTNANLVVQGNTMIHGNLTVEGSINGDRSIEVRLDKIEERLAILRPNSDLESRWEKLRELRRQYNELEQECWEKEEIIRMLKR